MGFVGSSVETTLLETEVANHLLHCWNGVPTGTTKANHSDDEAHNHMVSVLSLDDTRFIPWCRVLWCWYIIIMSKDQRTGRSPEDSADSKKDRPQPRPQCCRCATFSSATEGLPMHWPRGKCRVCQPEHVVQRGQGMCVNLPMNIRRMSW